MKHSRTMRRFNWCTTVTNMDNGLTRPIQCRIPLMANHYLKDQKYCTHVLYCLKFATRGRVKKNTCFSSPPASSKSCFGDFSFFCRFKWNGDLVCREHRFPYPFVHQQKIILMAWWWETSFFGVPYITSCGIILLTSTNDLLVTQSFKAIFYYILFYNFQWKTFWKWIFIWAYSR